MGKKAWRQIEPSGAVIAAATALALGLRFYQLSRPGYLFGLTEYDDGTFFGNSVRLAYGAIPYRDFVSVEPPGSTLIVLPVALIAKAVGTAWGLAIARVLTMSADVMSVVFAGLLVRHRGPLAVLLTCGILAVYPDGVFAAHTLLLEPWLNFFCLAGALLVFDRDRLAGGRLVLLGGLLFGFAVTIKVWAFAPALIIWMLCLPRPRRAMSFACGVITGIAVPVLPFAIAAPGGLLRDVLLGQLTRSDNGPALILPRLANLSGLSGISGDISAERIYLPAALVVAGSAAIGALVIAAYACATLVRRRWPTALDWYGLLGAAAVFVMFMWPSEFYPHYAAFFGPFLALAVSLPIGSLAAHRWPAAAAGGQVAPRSGGTAAQPVSPRPVGWLGGSAVRWARRRLGGRLGGRVGGRVGGWANAWAPKFGVAAVVAAIGLMALTQADVEEDAAPASEPAAMADRLIPPGACVVSDTVSLTVLSNRFVSDVRGCPLVVDSFGTLIASTDGRDMGASARVLGGIAGSWRSWFTRARFVWLDGATLGRIPWTHSLATYFASRFRRIMPYGGSSPAARGGLYVRVGGSQGGS